MSTETKQEKDYSGDEYLKVVDHLFIKQHIEIIEVLTHCQTPNKYAIRNHHRTLYYAIEVSSCCARFWLSGRRSLEMVLMNSFSNEEICRMQRSLKCACCCPYAQELTVYLPDEDEPLGIVFQEDSKSNILSINDADGDNILMVEGPKMKKCFSKEDYVFKLYQKDLENISLGSIKKHWSGWGQELLSSADNLSIVFPLHADVNTKLLIISAAFLIVIHYHGVTIDSKITMSLF